MGKLVEGKYLKPFLLLPAKPGTCPECAVAHEQNQPHNQQSLYYQYSFYNEHGVWPTWGDAMAHCDKATKQLWKSALLKRNVKANQLATSKS